MLTEVARWFKGRSANPRSVPPTWFSSKISEPARSQSGRLGLFQSWIPEHTGALVHAVSDDPSYLMVDLGILRDVSVKSDRVKALRFATANPTDFSKMVMHKLSPYRNDACFLLVTFDWQPFTRHFVYAAAKLGIPTILLPHESVFAAQDLYYRHPVLGINSPACDLVLAWGDLQEKIFCERGYPKDRIIKIGAPKLDYVEKLRGSSDRSGVLLLGLDPNKVTFTFAAQPLDSQFDTIAARGAQNRAISDLIKIAGELGCQVIIREPPSKDPVISAEVKDLISATEYAVLDEAYLYVLSPKETIAVSDVLLSINSTMLLEAALSGRVAISTKYLDFVQIWDGLRIQVARDQSELKQHLSASLIEPDRLRAQYDIDWAANLFSNGAFDGSAATRAKQILAEVANGTRDIRPGYALQTPFSPS